MGRIFGALALAGLALGAWGYHLFGGDGVATDMSRATERRAAAAGDAFLASCDEKLVVANGSIDELRKRAAAAPDERRDAMQDRVRHFERQRDMTLSKIVEYRTADEDRRRRLRMEIGKELEDLRIDLENALKGAE